MAVETFQVVDVEAAQQVAGRLYFEHRIEPIGDAQSFEMNLKVGRIGAVTAGILQYKTGMVGSASASDTIYGVYVPLSGPLNLRIGGTEIVADAGTAGLTRPAENMVAQVQSFGSGPVMLLKFDRHVLESELRRMIGREVPAPARLDPKFDLRNGVGRGWWQIAQAVATELNSPSDFAFNPLLTASLSSTLMTGLLLAAGHPYRDELLSDSRSAAPAVVQRAIRIIDERAQEPLTSVDIAAEVGCSLRSLQLGFNAHFGMSPNRYLMRVRLDRAHMELILGNPETTTVGEVGSRWGFSQPGRFANVYREFYGVTPSKTLRDR